MIRIALALVAALLPSQAVLAQADNPFNGTWAVSFEGTKTSNVDGAVVINGAGGTWGIRVQARNNPCVGREFPLTVRKATADELVFTVNRAATLAGCKDSTYTFRKADDKTLKGEIGEGRAASLTRK
jgi:hypothetical protein